MDEASRLRSEIRENRTVRAKKPYPLSSGKGLKTISSLGDLRP